MDNSQFTQGLKTTNQVVNTFQRETLPTLSINAAKAKSHVDNWISKLEHKQSISKESLQSVDMFAAAALILLFGGFLTLILYTKK